MISKVEVLYGPPGTGKTTSLVSRIRNMLSEGDFLEPEDVVVVSYTKAASSEIAKRVGNPGVRAQTLHSLCYRLAKLSPDQVFNPVWAKELQKISGIEISLTKSEELEELPEGDRYLALYSYARATLNTNYRAVFSDANAEGSLPKFLYFVETYESFKKTFGVVDFSDMLDLAIGLDPACKVLVLDEAQDFSPQQWQLVESFVPSIPRIIVAGDDDQAIYKWSGADPEGMFKFQTKYKATTRVLEQSYRIPSSVHVLANRLIGNVKTRVQKQYKPRDHVGTVNKYGNCRLVPFDPNEDTLILVRNHALRRPVEDVLLSSGIPYRTDGGFPGPLDNHFAKAIKLWIKLYNDVANGREVFLTDSDINAIKRCVQHSYRPPLERDAEALAVSGISWQRLFYFPKNLGPYYQMVMNKYGTVEVPTKIRISTIHNSKGREADHVVLINGMTERTAGNPDTDSELRTFYVGVTRAREKLSIVTEQNPLRFLL